MVEDRLRDLEVCQLGWLDTFSAAGYTSEQALDFINRRFARCRVGRLRLKITLPWVSEARIEWVDV